MKSAYELAMERFGQTLNVLTDEQKRQLAEIDRKYDARVAEARMSADNRLQAFAGDPEKATAVRDELVVELASLREKREREKKQVRDEIESSASK